MGQLDHEAQIRREREQEYRQQAVDLLRRAELLREQGFAMAAAASELRRQIDAETR